MLPALLVCVAAALKPSHPVSRRAVAVGAFSAALVPFKASGSTSATLFGVGSVMIRRDIFIIVGDWRIRRGRR